MENKNNSSFGAALVNKAEALRLPLDHIYVKQYYASDPQDFPLPFIGCNEKQIDEIKKSQDVDRLPQLYLEYLLHMGVASGDLYIGLDVGYRWLTGYSFRDAMNDALRFAKLDEIKNDYFVFYTRQTHTFLFFPLFQGDDPPVYIYSESSGRPDDPYLNGPLLWRTHLSIHLTDFIAERESKEAQDLFLAQYALPYRS